MPHTHTPSVTACMLLQERPSSRRSSPIPTYIPVSNLQPCIASITQGTPSTGRRAKRKGYGASKPPRSPPPTAAPRRRPPWPHTCRRYSSSITALPRRKLIAINQSSNHNRNRASIINQLLARPLNSYRSIPWSLSSAAFTG